MLHSLAARKIQRWYRALKPRDPTCPLTLEPLADGKTRIYRFYPTPGSRPIGYNIEKLLDYIELAHKEVDPMTRISYTQKDLVRFEVVCKYYGLGRAGPLQVRRAEIELRSGLARAALRSIFLPSNDLLARVFEGVLEYVYDAAHPLIDLFRLDPRAAETLLRDAISSSTRDDAFHRYEEFARDRIGPVVNEHLRFILDRLADVSD